MPSRDAFKLTGGINICTVFLMKRYRGSKKKKREKEKGGKKEGQ